MGASNSTTNIGCDDSKVNPPSTPFPENNSDGIVKIDINIGEHIKNLTYDGVKIIPDFKTEKVNVKIVDSFNSTYDTANNNINTFYDVLYKAIDSDTREITNIQNNELTLQMKNNTTTPNVYNTGGNLYINCNIYKNEEMYPNYANIILNDIKSNRINSELMKAFLEFITDKNFLTYYNYNEKLKTEHNLNDINLKTELNNSETILLNLNYNRSYTSTTTKSYINSFLHLFNRLIDYVITEDCTLADSTFGEYFMNLFVNEEGKIYDYGINTLMIPSLINWLSKARGDGLNTALNCCGYVEKGSKIFPTNPSENFETVEKWSDKETIISPYVKCAINFNNGVAKTLNYPFSDSGLSCNNIVQFVNGQYDYTQNMQLGFTKDNFVYTKEIEYAKRDKGIKTRGTNLSIIIVDGNAGSEPVPYINVSIDKNTLLSMMTKIKTDYSTGTQEIGKLSNSKTGVNCDISSTQTFNICQRRQNSTFLYCYELQTNNMSSFKNYIINKIKSSQEFKKYNEKECAITNVNIQSTTSVFKFNRKYLASVVNEVYKNVDNYGVHLNYGNCLNDRSVKIKTVGKFTNITDKYPALPSTISFKVTFKLEYWGSTANMTTYKGSYDKSVPEQYKGDVYPLRSQEAISMYTTLKKLYVFNDQVFDYWKMILKLQNNQQYILNEIRNVIKDNIQLILMNVINNKFGKYIKTLNQNVSYIGIPIGPPLVVIPSSYVIDYKYYFPSFTINNNIDSNYVKYNSTKSTNTIINSVSCKKTNNYLDVLFNALITTSQQLNVNITEDSYISYIIPSKGYQLFEVIDKSIVSLLPSDAISGIYTFSDSNSIFYDYNTPQLIISMKDLSKDSKFITALTSYKFITSVSIPLINAKIDNDIINININTMNDDSRNKCYIYVSNDKANEIISNLKSSEQKDKNNINNTLFNISYNGIDSERTPICLQLNFI